MAPATGAGAVAPAMPAERSSTGMPPLMQASMTSQLSVANFIGGTTKQLEFDTKGRARQASSPPATMCRSSRMSGTKAGSKIEVPTCLVVPETQA